MSRRESFSFSINETLISIDHGILRTVLFILMITMIITPSLDVHYQGLETENFVTIGHDNFYKVKPVNINSPDGSILMSVYLLDHPDGSNELCYSMSIDGDQVINRSNLGLIFNDGSDQIGKNLNLIGTMKTTVNRSYSMVKGDRDIYPERYQQVVFTFNETEVSNRSFKLNCKVFDEGISFRYELPTDFENGAVTIFSEKTQFHLNSDDLCMAEYGVEGTYSQVKTSAVKSGCEIPLTIKTSSDHYLSINEANLHDYSRMLLKPDQQTDALKVHLYSSVRASTPLKTPWRVIIAGESYSDLTNNAHIAYSLCPNPIIENTSWIRNGKAMRDTSLTTTGCKSIIDFCHDRGMDYVHLDAGWYGDEHSTGSDASTVSAPNLNLSEVIRYGKKNGVGVIVYVNNKALRRNYQTLFPLYEKWGLAGVKFGFVDGRSQTGINQLQKYLIKAAEHHLVVDIHDNLRPTGLTRTYPNLLTMEGVRGQEYFPTADHNVNLAFTRGIAGPLDYTPRSKANGDKTTVPHQLALPIIYYSPLTYLHWYNKPSNLEGRKELEMWRDLPTTWNESKYLSCSPDDHVSVIRRSDNMWYYAYLSGSKAGKINLNLSFLQKGIGYQALIIRNGNDGNIFYSNYTVDSKYRIIEEISKKGGLTIKLDPIDTLPSEDSVEYPARINDITSIIIEEDTKKIIKIAFCNGIDELNFAHSDLPNFLKFDSETGLLLIEPSNDNVGVHNVNIRVSDEKGIMGWYNTTITVVNVNDPPMLIDLPEYIIAKNGQDIHFTPQVLDIDPTNDELRWSMETDASFLDIDPFSGVVTGIPRIFIQGSFNIGLTVNDGCGGFCFGHITLIVENGGELIFISTRIKMASVLEDHLFTMKMETWSNNGEPENITWSLETKCSFIDIDEDTGEIKGIPREVDIGEFIVNVNVRDGLGKGDTISFSLVVLGVNDPPVIKNMDQVHIITLGEELIIGLYAVDEDDPDDSLFWEIEEGPKFVSIDPCIGTIFTSPGHNDKGVSHIIISVSDPHGAKVFITLVIVVVEKIEDVKIIDVPVNGSLIEIPLPAWNYTSQIPIFGDDFNLTSDMIIVLIDSLSPEDIDDLQHESSIDYSRNDCGNQNVVMWMEFLLLGVIIILMLFSFIRKKDSRKLIWNGIEK